MAIKTHFLLFINFTLFIPKLCYFIRPYLGLPHDNVIPSRLFCYSVTIFQHMTNSYKYLYWNDGNKLGEYNIIKNERDIHQLPRYSKRAEFLLSIIKVRKFHFCQ